MGSMAKTALATTDQDNRQTEEGSSDGPLMDTTNLAVKNLIKKGSNYCPFFNSSLRSKPLLRFPFL